MHWRGCNVHSALTQEGRFHKHLKEYMSMFVAGYWLFADGLSDANWETTLTDLRLPD